MDSWSVPIVFQHQSVAILLAQIRRIKDLKTNFLLNYVQRLSSYRAVNIIWLSYNKTSHQPNTKMDKKMAHPA